MTTSGPDRTNPLKRATERAPRRTGLRAALFFATAVVTALAAALLFTRYLEARAAGAKVPMAQVVVAAMDVPAATALRAEALATIEWPTNALPAGTSPDPAALVGRVILSAVAKGEPILDSRLAEPGAASGLSAVLPAGMRAVAVRVDDVVGVAGFVHPGDMVDVIVTMRPTEGSGAQPMSKIVLQKVRVLAVGKQVERAERAGAEKAIPATVATLMVDGADSERLALAAAKGQLLLSLRSAADDDLVDTNGITPPVLLAGGVQAATVVTTSTTTTAPAAPRHAAAPARRQARAAEPPKPQPAEQQTVEILRGDLFERRDFAKGAGK